MRSGRRAETEENASLRASVGELEQDRLNVLVSPPTRADAAAPRLARRRRLRERLASRINPGSGGVKSLSGPGLIALGVAQSPRCLALCSRASLSIAFASRNAPALLPLHTSTRVLRRCRLPFRSLWEGRRKPLEDLPAGRSGLL